MKDGHEHKKLSLPKWSCDHKIGGLKSACSRDWMISQEKQYFDETIELSHTCLKDKERRRQAGAEQEGGMKQDYV